MEHPVMLSELHVQNTKEKLKRGERETKCTSYVLSWTIKSKITFGKIKKKQRKGALRVCKVTQNLPVFVAKNSVLLLTYLVSDKQLNAFIYLIP